MKNNQSNVCMQYTEVNIKWIYVYILKTCSSMINIIVTSAKDFYVCVDVVRFRF